MQTTAMRAQPLMATKASAPRAARKTVVVRAMAQEEVATRRAALALAAAAVIGFGAVETADAVTAAKNASTASQSGYIMEGTKKMGISAKQKGKIMSNVRAKALAASQGKAPAPAE